MPKYELKVHIIEQTRNVTIECSEGDLQAYLDGCLDANIHPQGERLMLSPQGENDGLDALHCSIERATKSANELLGGIEKVITAPHDMEAITGAGYDIENPCVAALVYKSGVFIELYPTGMYWTIVDRTEFQSKSLDEVERFIVKNFGNEIGIDVGSLEGEA